MRVENECSGISPETNRFEMVLVAAREARRLNATLQEIGKVGVTRRLNPVMLALERVRAGLISDESGGEASSEEVPMVNDREAEVCAAQLEPETDPSPVDDHVPEAHTAEFPLEEKHPIQVEQIIP